MSSCLYADKTSSEEEHQTAEWPVNSSSTNMLNERYYYKLKLPLRELCIAYQKPVPKRESLRLRASLFPFHNEEFHDLERKGGPFSDGMLEALANWLEVRPESIAQFTAETPTRLRTEDRDVFRLGWETIVKLIARDLGVHARSYLKTEDEVVRASQDINLTLGRQLADELPSHKTEQLSEEELHQLAGQNSGIEQQLFAEKLLEWWRKNPRTCLAAFGRNNVRWGATCLLPVSSACYDSFRSGQISISQIAAQDILFHSTSFILVACAERFQISEDCRRMTKALAGCVLCQLAHCVPLDEEHQIRGLSCGTSATFRLRLEFSGFKNLNTYHPRTKWLIHELTPDSPGGAGIPRGIQIARSKLKR